MKIRSHSIGILVAAVTVLLVPALARCDINGFGDFSQFMINNGDGGASPSVSIATGTINLINGGGEVRSIFGKTPQPIANPFTVSFTFKGNGGDGTFFVLQNNAAGASALGSQYGYAGMAKSVAVALVVNSNTGLYTNGIIGGSISSSPVNSFSNDPINVTLTYNGGILNEQLVDTTTLASFNTSYLVNIPSDLGSSSAFAGFTAGSGSGYSQSISNFQFGTVPEPNSLGILLVGIGAIGTRRRRSTRR